MATQPSNPTVADIHFRALCETGSLENIRILRHPVDTRYLLGVNASLFDPETGSLHLEYRFGYRDERLVPRTQEDREMGLRAWVGVNGARAPKLTDEEASFMGYAEFGGIRSDASREHVYEAFRQMERIWEHAHTQVLAGQEAGVDIGDTVIRLNMISVACDPGVAWKDTVLRQVKASAGLGGVVESVAFWAPFTAADLEHFPKVSVSCRFTPAGGSATYGVESSWRRAEAGAVLDLRIVGLPGRREDRLDGWGGLAALLGDEVADQLHAVGDWLQALGMEATGYLTGRVRGIGVRLLAGDDPEPGAVGRDALVVRAEAARSAALARLGLWAAEVLG